MKILYLCADSVFFISFSFYIINEYTKKHKVYEHTCYLYNLKQNNLFTGFSSMDFDQFYSLQHVGWWSPTIVRGEDREAVHIPNHKFTVNVVRNLTQKSHWRIKTHLAISHLDVNKINVRNKSRLSIP